MNKLFLCFLLLASLSCQAEVLEAQVQTKVTIKQASEIAIETFPKRMTLKAYAALDSDIPGHLKARVQKQMCFPDHQITVFENTSYAVTYFGRKESLYYDAKGQTFMIEVHDRPYWPSDYPFYSAKYVYPGGTLVGLVYHSAFAEGYAFDPSGALQSFCLQDKCYSPDQSQVLTRGLIPQCTAQGQPL